MKSQTRAWVITLIVLITWSTLAGTPFQYFADMIAKGAGWLLNLTGLPAVAVYLLTYLVIGGLTCLFLLLGRKKYRLYLAGFFVLAIFIHHLIVCLRTSQLYEASVPIVITLALALVLLLIRNKKPGLWLSDGFIMALPVWLLYDSLFALLYSVLSWQADRWQPYFLIAEKPGIYAFDGLLGIPWQAWIVVPVIFALLPLVFLAKNRER